MSLNGSRIFLDTCVFFDCTERPSTRKVLLHAIRSGGNLVTSITVLGEYVQECLPDRSELLNAIPELIDEFDIDIVRPDRRLRLCCLAMDKVVDRKVSYGTDFSDRTHIAYAARHGCNYFLTNDRPLQGLKNLQSCKLFEECNELETTNETNCFPTIQAMTVDDLEDMMRPR